MPRSIARWSCGIILLFRCAERWFTSRSENALCVLGCPSGSRGRFSNPQFEVAAELPDRCHPECPARGVREPPSPSRAYPRNECGEGHFQFTFALGIGDLENARTAKFAMQVETARPLQSDVQYETARDIRYSRCNDSAVTSHNAPRVNSLKVKGWLCSIWC